MLAYVDATAAGARPANRWMRLAARRFLRDLERPDLVLDWSAVAQVDAHCARLQLVGESSGQPFRLAPWQLWLVACLYGWRYADDGSRRTSLCLLQVARGNGKTTLAAALALYDLWAGGGRRVHVIANRIEQAAICVGTARTMARPLERPGTKILWDRVVCPDDDCELSPLPASRNTIDGLTPTLWVADEVHEFTDPEILPKLESATVKTRGGRGLIVSTPAGTPDGVYGTFVSRAESVLEGESNDDAYAPFLFGIDADDDLGDESAWHKANPNMEHGVPTVRSLRAAWERKRRDQVGRSEFSRYHCARTPVESTNWLDMELWPGGQEIDWKALEGRDAYVGVDLSKSMDMTAVVLAVPLPDGRVALQGSYFWPDANLERREREYRLPVRQWSELGHLTLTPGAAIDHGQVAACVADLGKRFNLVRVGFDRWGAADFVKRLETAGVPLEGYSMGVSTFGPGCQLFQQLWASRRMVVGHDPILQTACRQADAHRDRNGNITVTKEKQTKVIDALVASIIAVHCWGGQSSTSYDFLLQS